MDSDRHNTGNHHSHSDETETDFEIPEESWAHRETSTFRMKPVIILAAIVLVGGASAFGYFRYTDPAAAYDRAPIVNQASSSDDEIPHKAEPEIVMRAAEKTPKTEKSVVNHELASPDPDAVAEPSDEEPEVAPEPEAEPESVPEKAEGNYEELLASARKERRAKAKAELLREAIKANPSGHEAMAHLALALMERRTTQDEALEMGLRSTELENDNGMAWLAVGYIKQMKGSAAEAKKAYRNCANSSGPARYVRDCKRMR